ncbi:DUF302 domain-containing protein [Phaeobacter gallaeciensis]|uniref:DUF302 domain-containing protein n=1 Tax=Phaeobacter gallaeciensis TaxID=60890 RepID=A0AAC9Z918_9RHOB|nr:DUF302 domain-containing protein [Phaeobacter gallaeciensis]AHD09917.1 Uncharacterized protein Gal_02169 [Phaeobacter gallaeciensis DSM 26640]ATE93181.1 hypothetical protein PhaeoP11_02160 [Phaeobacter gallaeciensis]ATE96997.1 hypothetical protein PhaeoP73_01686 [Phaeobacter gallaeciensis]ATF01846.1 hypothetical protein PhaeoP75_02210 [Phaeobacter gallaeciensis]ATF06226.1 hypothetical protein PhaeoP63_02159 [Phaeobacter gallaeciensis]
MIRDLIRLSRMSLQRATAVLILTGLALLQTAVVAAGPLTDRPGWAVHHTTKPYAQLVRDVITATKSQGLTVVTQAGPTKAAAARGITIPGNRVIGVFNNDYAVRVLRRSTAAMIEAPIRLYVTEDTDATATLSYKTATHVFAPYLTEGGQELADIAAELDQHLEAIAQNAVQSAP